MIEDVNNVSKLSGLVKNRTRNWSKVYCQNVDNREIDYQEKIKAKDQQKVNTFEMLLSRLRVNKLLSKYIKSRLKTRYHSVRKSIENMSVLREKPTDWAKEFGSQSFCDYCRKPAISDCLQCGVCNVVYHRACYNNTQFIYQNPSSILDDEELQEDRIICTHCEESASHDNIQYRKHLEELKKERIINQYKKYLSRFIYSYIVRRRFIKLKNGLTIAQTIFRRIIDRKRFINQRKKQLHILVIEINRLPAYFTNGLVTLTIIDPIRPLQVLRMDKRADKVYEEGFLIPGTNLSLLMVITISDENGIILGQTKFSLKDRGSNIIGGLRKKESLVLGDSGKIMWPPSDSKEEGSSIHLSLPHITTGNKAKSTQSSIESHQTFSPENQNYLIDYNYISSLSSMCSMVMAPPIDVLRKAAEIYSGLKRDIPYATDRRSSRYWLVLIELKLIFFQNFGDTKARFSSNIHETEVTLQNDLTSVRLCFPDKRTWVFEFESKLLAKRFEFSIVESQKHYFNKSSLYIKGNRYEDFLRVFC